MFLNAYNHPSDRILPQNNIFTEFLVELNDTSVEANELVSAKLRNSQSSTTRRESSMSIDTPRIKDRNVIFLLLTSSHTGNNYSDKMAGKLALLVEFLTSLAKIAWYITIGIFKLFAPIKKKDVKNEIVLVTGAGSGIGRLIALRYESLI